MAASCPKSDNTDPEYECTQGCGRDDCKRIYKIYRYNKRKIKYFLL